MNRRDFLRYVGTGLVVGPAAVKAILATPAVAASGNPLFSGELGVWQGVRWWVKEFDFGNQVGVALGVTNPKTGQLVRNAVRFCITPGNREAISKFMDRVWEAPKQDYTLLALPEPPDAVLACQRLLGVWAEEESWRQGLARPPKGWRVRTAETRKIRLIRSAADHEAYLEGREMRA